MRFLFSQALFVLLLVAGQGPARARRAAGRRVKARLSRPRRPSAACRGKRYDCTGKPPSYYDRFVRVVSKPRRGYDRACLRRLRKAGIKFRILAGVKGVRTPVEVLSKRLGGVRYIKHWSNHRRFILDCHTVEVLAWVGPAIRRAGVASVYYASSWRYTYLHGTHRLSQHAYGKALDVPAIDGAFGYATVVRHWERRVWGCGERNKTPKGRAWKRFLCALKMTRAFGRILNPDNRADHGDHLHLESPNPSIRLGRTPPPRWGRTRRARRRTGTSRRR